MDILSGPVWSRQDADLGMCRVDGVYIVTVCIRAHYMLVWGCSRVASGPFCACAAATATAVLFWWSVWLWSCCLWCALWSSLALIGVQKHRGVLVCRRGHRKHDNDPQSGGTGAGKYRQNKRQRKFLTSAGFPSVWCLSGVPEGLLIAGDHQTSIQTRGKSNSPPSRSRRRERGRRCSLLRRVYSRMAATWVRLVHCDRP